MDQVMPLPTMNVRINLIMYYKVIDCVNLNYYYFGFNQKIINVLINLTNWYSTIFLRKKNLLLTQGSTTFFKLSTPNEKNVILMSFSKPFIGFYENNFQLYNHKGISKFVDQNSRHKQPDVRASFFQIKSTP